MAVDRVRKEMGLLEKISTYLPGYRGYKEKELRRETDILVRRKVSMILSEARSTLNTPLNPSAARKLAYNPEAKFMFENIRAELDKITQKIDKAVAGYAGLFDAVKVREDKLDAVIQHDLSLIQKAEVIKDLVSQLLATEAGGDEWRSRAGELKTALAEFDGLVDERARIFRGLAEVVG